MIVLYYRKNEIKQKIIKMYFGNMMSSNYLRFGEFFMQYFMSSSTYYLHHSFRDSVFQVNNIN